MKTNFLLLAMAMILACNFQSFAAPFAGELDRSFNPTLGRVDTVRVRAIAPQPNGKFIVAGSFLKVNNQQVNAVVRFNADGSLDSTFDAAGTVFGAVSVLSLQPDGKIIVGGSFDSVGRQIRRRIARLNSDGSFDPTFAPPVQAAAGNLIAAAAQPDGKIIVYGASLFAGRDFARLNQDGSIDTSFAGNNLIVNSIAVQPDGKILISGSSFTIGGQTRIGLARLNADGSLDTSFVNQNIGDTSVFKVVVMPNGKIMIGGLFGTIGGQPFRRLARLNSDGSLDPSFTNNVNRNVSVREIAVQSDGKVVYSGLDTPIYRDNADGTPDTAFVTRSRIYTTVHVVAALTDDRIVVGGRMVVSTVTPPNSSQTRDQPMALLAADGTLDDSVNPDIAYSEGLSPVDVLVQSDGKILFTEDYEQALRSFPLRHIVRLNPGGSLDTSFTFPTVSSNIINTTASVVQLARQSDGKIIFGTINNNASNRNVFRLNTDGSFDAGFNVTFGGNSGDIYRLEVLADDDILIYGNFTQINGQARAGFARLNFDGSLDSFYPTLTTEQGVGTPAINGIVVQADGKFYLGGNFNTVNGFASEYFARFNTDGSVDTSFSSSFTLFANQVSMLSAQPDGKLLLGSISSILRLNVNGSVDSGFTSPSFRGVNGTSVVPVVTAVYPNGKILVGGGFYYVGDFIPRQGFARLNADGSLDQTYGINGGTSGSSNVVYKIELQADGKAIIAGRFAYVNNISQFTIARLNQTATNSVPLADFDGDGKSDFSVFRNGMWFINPSGAPSFADAPNAAYGVQFGLGTDKLVPADYDGDGKTDVAVWRAGDFAYFYILNSSNNTFRAEQFGQTGDNPIVVGNWDADSKADLAVYRGGEQSLFFYRPTTQPSVNFETIYWGTSGDEAIRGDFDGDGKLDAATFRASNNLWYIRQSSNNLARYESWGTATDKRVSGDFDADGKTDLAIFRDGLWAIRQSSSNQQRYETFGQTGDKVAAGDYDGDGKTDLAVFRNGVFYVKQSSNSQSTAQSFGAADDVPIASAFVQ